MTKLNKIKERISKLLRLAQSENVNEAATAAAHAARLMERYQIDQAMLADGEAMPVEITSQVIWKPKGKKLPGWVSMLAWGLGSSFSCKVFNSNYPRCIRAAGSQEDIDLLSLTLTWLMGEIERLLKEERPKGMHRGESRSWGHSFRLGAVQTIAQRIAKAKQDERKRLQMTREERYALALEENDLETLTELDREPEIGTTFALTRINNAIAVRKEHQIRVDEWAKKKFNLRPAAGPRVTRGDGFAKGRSAGNRANLKGPKGLL